MQQSLREDTTRGRGRPDGGVPPSRPNPVSWRGVGRVLLIGTGVGVFLSLLGPFSSLQGWLTRAAQYLLYSWTGSMLGLAGARLSWRLGLWSYGMWVAGLATGLMMAPLMGALVWVVISLVQGHPTPARNLPEILWDTLLICVGASVIAMLLARRRAPAPDPPPKFLDRLPLKLRGAELWAVQAEDHYLRLHTSKGQDLILMRMADAVEELAGIEGAQVHRSWWVARDAIVDARRGDGRATLMLKGGSQAPVSRTYARLLRERNWL